MRYLVIPLLIFAFLIPLMPAPAAGDTVRSDLARIESATAILDEIMAIPEDSIPEGMLKNAYGIAVFPGVLKAAFIVGARFGQGVFVARSPDGSWSNPSFLSLIGGNFGLQIGAESTDLILVFRTKNSVDALGKGDITLGATVSVAAGPIGRSAQASTDIQLKAEIYSYSKTRGLFGGIALDGTAIRVDSDANYAIYGVHDPLRTAAVRIPEQSRRFSCVVAKHTGQPARVCA
jgi:lipid-binding SYLF domain-containing protein